MRHWLRGEGGWFSGLRAWWLERKVSRISRVLLDSLKSLELLASVTPGPVVSLGKDSVRIRLMAVSVREESLFVSALREVFDPLQSPRYLLVAKDEVFAVPRVFAERKERAEVFAKLWRRRVGNFRLVFSHTAEGKQCLLRAKERYLASRFHLRTESRQRWS